MVRADDSWTVVVRGEASQSSPVCRAESKRVIDKVPSISEKVTSTKLIRCSKTATPRPDLDEQDLQAIKPRYARRQSRSLRGRRPVPAASIPGRGQLLGQNDNGMKIILSTFMKREDSTPFQERDGLRMNFEYYHP